MQARVVTSQAEWNALVSDLPYAHVLQTWEWGVFKQATTGWTPERLAFERDGRTVAAAQVLTRRVGPLAISYASKGPALDYADVELRGEVLALLLDHARRNGSLMLKIDPDVIRSGAEPAIGDAFASELEAGGWRFSREQIQFRNTGTIDLTLDEESLLANMKQKTRYNTRLAQRKEVTVREGTADDIPLLYDLYKITGQRDGFLIRPLEYYQQAWGAFMQAGLAQALIAEYQGKALAHVIIFKFGQRAWYFYGASSDEERNRMPTYLLQWEAMRRARAQGHTLYDLWGAPDNFDNPDDRLAGVWRFKQGLGAQAVQHTGAWDYPLRPAQYWLYTRVLPAVLGVMRRARRDEG